MHAVDELLGLDLIRATDVPRRFRFRHPLVRRAVYEGTAGGWRLGAHERCAEALAARGASAAARAHHVERSARQGDLAAVALLRDAGEATARLAPQSAARWFGGALRLLPQTAPTQDRVELLLARSWALAAVGRFTDSHEAALEAVALVPGQPSALDTTVATACASVERFLGRYEHAHARLVNPQAPPPRPHAAAPCRHSPPRDGWRRPVSAPSHPCRGIRLQGRPGFRAIRTTPARGADHEVPAPGPVTTRMPIRRRNEPCST